MLCRSLYSLRAGQRVPNGTGAREPPGRQRSVLRRVASAVGRSLISLRRLVDGTLADIRSAASHHRPEQVMINVFLQDIAIPARLQAEYSGLTLVIEPAPAELAASVDRHSMFRCWSIARETPVST